MILRGYYNSDVLHSCINIQFIIPDTGAGPYKVVYLLHGLHGNQGTWIDYTALPYFSKEYDAIFVIPEAGRSFYCNPKYGRKYYSFVSEELPQISRKIFNISDKREDTAVMGCSMGGYGSLKLALTNPEQFGFCGSIAAACVYLKPILDGLREDADSYRKKGAEEEEILNDLYTIYGDDLEYVPENDISALVKNFPAGKPLPKIYATCGTEDSLLEENRKLVDEMKNTAFDFTYEEWAGGHDWYFFNDALKKTLDFWYNRNAKKEQG
jgi:S-formylglutathione hydrolase FrmB